MIQYNACVLNSSLKLMSGISWDRSHFMKNFVSTLFATLLKKHNKDIDKIVPVDSSSNLIWLKKTISTRFWVAGNSIFLYLPLRMYQSHIIGIYLYSNTASVFVCLCGLKCVIVNFIKIYSFTKIIWVPFLGMIQTYVIHRS